VSIKEIRAAFRQFHALREYAEREGIFVIESNGKSVSLLDMERIISEDGPLPRRAREAFVLSLVEDMTPEAVASEMGISKGSVAQHVNNALRIVAQEWQPVG
jgi:DNA-directed RNA polymerase specialized sigma24 family protein